MQIGYVLYEPDTLKVLCLTKGKRAVELLEIKDTEKLNRALFVNYCKCIKKLKYSKKYEIGFEYPICMSSIYKKRGLKPPKDVKKKCKNYYG